MTVNIYLISVYIALKDTQPFERQYKHKKISRNVYFNSAKIISRTEVEENNNLLSACNVRTYTYLPMIKDTVNIFHRI